MPTDPEKIEILVQLSQDAKLERSLISAKIDTLIELSMKHERTLYGNGKPGVMERLANLENSQIESNRLSGELHGSSTAPGIMENVRQMKVIVEDNNRVLNGTDGEPGLVDTVRDIKKRIDTETKIMWLVLGGAVSILLGYIANVFLN